MLAVVAPVLHWYEDAPLAISVAEPPGHRDEGEDEIERLGGVFTVTVTFAVLEHTSVVPVTVYVVVDEGLTVMLAEVSPVLHL